MLVYIQMFRCGKTAPDDYDYEQYNPDPIPDDTTDDIIEMLDYFSLGGEFDITADKDGRELIAVIRMFKKGRAGWKETLLYDQYYKLEKLQKTLFK